MLGEPSAAGPTGAPASLCLRIIFYATVITDKPGRLTALQTNSAAGIYVIGFLAFSIIFVKESQIFSNVIALKKIKVRFSLLLYRHNLRCLLDVLFHLYYFHPLGKDV